MKRQILVTGFEPFGGESINPSWEAVKLLPDMIGGCRVEKLLLPVEFGRAAELAWRCALECSADTILCIGQAGGRRAVTPERVAINLRNGRSGDRVYSDAPCVDSAPTAYFTDLPIRTIVEHLSAHGIPSTVSYSAGTYVCNDTMYTLMHNAARLKESGGRDIRVGFVHLPYLPEQAKNDAFSLPLETLAEAVRIAVEAVCE